MGRKPPDREFPGFEVEARLGGSKDSDAKLPSQVDENLARPLRDWARKYGWWMTARGSCSSPGRRMRVPGQGTAAGRAGPGLGVSRKSKRHRRRQDGERPRGTGGCAARRRWQGPVRHGIVTGAASRSSRTTSATVTGKYRAIAKTEESRTRRTRDLGLKFAPRQPRVRNALQRTWTAFSGVAKKLMRGSGGTDEAFVKIIHGDGEDFQKKEEYCRGYHPRHERGGIWPYRGNRRWPRAPRLPIAHDFLSASNSAPEGVNPRPRGKRRRGLPAVESHAGRSLNSFRIPDGRYVLREIFFRDRETRHRSL